MNGPESEIGLINRARKSRDAAAFSALVKMHQHSVRGFLARLCKNYSKADDLAQDTFLIAFEKIASYNGTGSFQGWLLRIAYHCFLQLERKVAREQQINALYVQQFIIDADKYEAATEGQLDLERAMAQLTTNEAGAITLCHSYGFTHTEAAVILGLPAGTVKSHISRGKGKLRQLLISYRPLSNTELERA